MRMAVLPFRAQLPELEEMLANRYCETMTGVSTLA